MTKWVRRGKIPRKDTKINCPEHGMQPVYDLWGLKNKKEIEGVGCIKCFNKLPKRKEKR